MQRVKKKTLNVLIDVLAYVAFLALAMTGVIMYYILPPGSGHSLSIWGLGRHDWGDVHFWAAITFFVVLVLHLVLHWNWIISILKGTPRTGSRWRFLLGSVGLIALIFISMAPLLSPVERNSAFEGKNEKSSLSAPVSAEEIKGSMTLQEVSDIFGIPIEEFLEFMDLPENTDPTRKLGQLKAEYGFDMHELRRFVEENER